MGLHRRQALLYPLCRLRRALLVLLAAGHGLARTAHFSEGDEVPVYANKVRRARRAHLLCTSNIRLGLQPDREGWIHAARVLSAAPSWQLTRRAR